MDLKSSYRFRFSKVPLSCELTKRLEAAANSLFSDLKNIRPSDLNISEHSKRYLTSKLQNLESILTRDAYVIAGIFSESPKSLEDIIFIEYGGGTGFLSLLARKLGIGTVIYNDIDDVICRDAQRIAHILGSDADYYVQGDIDDLIAFCDRYKLKCDGMSSYDVLEQIYDIDDFCKKLHLLSHEGTVMLHSTGANMFSYPYTKFISKKQIAAETKDRESERGQRNRDCLLAYSKVRGQIIRDYASNLNDDEIKQLVTNTRGLMQEDVIKCVAQYTDSKQFPKLIEHPTNTCDPYTGNWMEHLMNPYYLAETLSFNGFDTKVLPGYWGTSNQFIEDIIAHMLNFAIRISSLHAGLYFSSFYSIYAKYTGKFCDKPHKQHIYRYRRSLLWYLIMVLWEPFSVAAHIKARKISSVYPTLDQS